MSVEALVGDVLELSEVPLDRWETAALLESQGVRDVDARERYGCADVFALADEVYVRARKRVEASPPSRKPAERETFLRRVGENVSYYATGSFFIVPMTIQLGTLFVFGFGLWISLDFTNRQFTIVAVATILSFLVSDGFVGVLGRLAITYADQGKHQLAIAIVRRVLVLAVGVVLIAAGILVLAEIVGDVFPRHLALVGLVYFLLLCALWLSTGVLYVVRHRPAIVLGTIVGLGTVAALHDGAGYGLYASQWSGIAAASLFALAWSGVVLGRRARHVSETMQLARLPRTPLLVSSTIPYFLYGSLYYGFLFADRVVAWSTSGKPPDWPLWFRTPYELGLDWALASLLPAIALLEYVINRFADDLVPLQQRTSALRMNDLNASILRFYRRHFALVLFVALAGIASVYAFGLWLRGFDGVQEIHNFFASSRTYDVHHVASAGYGLLVLGLLNGVFIGSLSRPWLVLRALAAGVAVSLVTGAVLTRIYDDYWYSAVGMTAGAGVFALLTTWSTVRLLRRADYHVYAAY